MARSGDGYILEAPHHFTMRFPVRVGEIELDGSLLAPVRDNLYIIPAGRHTVKPVGNVSGTLSPHQFYPRILSITGSLLSVRYAMRSLSFSYAADGRCLVTVSREPHTLTVDGRQRAFYTMKGNDGYTIFLPAGEHEVELVAGDAFSYGVNLTSFWSSTAIAAFGLASVAALLLMYAVVVVRRRSLVTERQRSS
jgi:hypothetical protein